MIPVNRTAVRIARSTLAAVLTVFTVSCTTYHRASPPTPSQQSSLHQAPTQRPYTVNGHQYEPLSSHQGFVEEGLASSYGSEFHGRRTSNGETFDMQAMTAAHKTLPLGVYVRVRHKRTGQEVVVRVNDRGPFVRDRIIDLSEAAAVQLGILQEGIAPVTVTALGFSRYGDTPSSGYLQGDYDSGRFTLQVGAFTVKGNASRYADELKRKYGSSDIQESFLNRAPLYRVRTGNFMSLSAARAAQSDFERAGFKGCFIVAVD